MVKLNLPQEEMKSRIVEELEFFDVLFVGMVREAVKFRARDYEFLARSGLFNRLFRRWYQTTWLWQDWTDEFSGTTPRQLVEGIGNGLPDASEYEWYISCHLVKIEEGWGIEKYFFPYRLDGDGKFILPLPVFSDFPWLYSLLERGMGMSQKGKLNAAYENDHWYNFVVGDREYLPWIVGLLKDGDLLQFKKSNHSKLGKVFLAEKGRAYFSLGPGEQLPYLLRRLFGQASSKICHDILDKGWPNHDKIREGFHHTIKETFSASGREWISMDKFFAQLWGILKEADPQRILPFDALEDLKGWKKRRPVEAYTSEFTSYNLGLAIDKYLLHPLDRYLGLIECVWTEPENFAQDVTQLLSLAKELSKINWIYLAEDLRKLDQFRDALFCPCTSFRLTEISLPGF